MLMKADTNIAFGEEFVALDKRETPAFTPAQAPAQEENNGGGENNNGGGENAGGGE